MCWTYPFSKLLVGGGWAERCPRQPRLFSGMKDEDVMAPEEAELAKITLPPRWSPLSVRGMGTISAVTGICFARRLWRLPEVKILFWPWNQNRLILDKEKKNSSFFKMYLLGWWSSIKGFLTRWVTSGGRMVAKRALEQRYLLEATSTSYLTSLLMHHHVLSEPPLHAGQHFDEVLLRQRQVFEICTIALAH